jgi:hypothetical protein
VPIEEEKKKKKMHLVGYLYEDYHDVRSLFYTKKEELFPCLQKPVMVPRTQFQRFSVHSIPEKNILVLSPDLSLGFKEEHFP